MGCFDSLYLPCEENDCHGKAELQSKAGECSMAEYTLLDCPPNIAGDLIGKTGQCNVCGRSIRLAGRLFLMAV